jgi:hypothetical protein
MPQYFLELSCVSVLIRPFLTLLGTLESVHEVGATDRPVGDLR